MSGRPTRADLAACHGAVVEDLVGPGLRLLVVGINPGLWTAAVGAHFARPGNRFWPAVHRAGITPTEVDASAGLSASDREMVLRAGLGITNIVPVATARADELTPEQLRAGAVRLERFVGEHAPRVVAVLGVTAYRRAFGRPRAVLGRQPDGLAGAELHVLGNPSGLNAHETVDTSAAALREVAVAAGIVLHR